MRDSDGDRHSVCFRDKRLSMFGFVIERERERARGLVCKLATAWSSNVEGDEGLCLPSCQTNLVIVLQELFRHFINTTTYLLNLYEPSSSSTKELHG